MQSADEASPNSNLSSPAMDESTYGTPGDKSLSAGPETPVMGTGKQNDQDPQLVVGAGRSIKNMLVDLMGVLEPQAKSKIFIQGEITLRVEGRESYTISLYNEDNLEPSAIKVRIDKATIPGKFPHEELNGSGPLADRKRAQSPVELTKDADVPQKRRRVGSGERQEESSTPTPEDMNAIDREPESLSPTVITKLNNVSAQIKWVEECRRIADDARGVREETWRSTSATFHDDNRKARERHEAWVVQEMAWQRNMLINLTTLAHSSKWETPSSMAQTSPIAPSMPMPTPGQASSFVPYNSKPGRPKGNGAAGKAIAAGRPIASNKPK